MGILNILFKSTVSMKENSNTSASKTAAANAKEEKEGTAPDNASDTPKPATDGRRVHNLIILDESGSMSSIYHPALTGVNETLQTIREACKEHPGQEHFVTLVTFDTGHYNKIYYNTPAEKTIDINERQYRPSGGTPLYDAMGHAITQLRDYVAPDDVVLVTIITDGYENASREYNGRAIKALVENMKSKGWVFTYIGANQDVEKVAASISIDNHLSFECTDTGANEMFEKEMRCRKRMFGKIANNESRDSLGSDYFNEDND